MAKILGKKKFSYIRTTPYKLKKIEGFIPPKKVNLDLLKDSFDIVLNKLEKVIELPKKIIAKAVSIGERIKDIKKLIRNSNNLSFKDILKKKNNKMEAVISFLAMLELVKQRELVVNQEKMFGDLNISKNKEINF